MGLQQQQQQQQRGRRRRGAGPTSLARLTLLVTGAALDKSEQVSDWGKRPLTASQLRYAALDAAVLPFLLDQVAPSFALRLRFASDWRFTLLPRPEDGDCNNNNNDYDDDDDDDYYYYYYYDHYDHYDHHDYYEHYGNYDAYDCDYYYADDHHDDNYNY